MSRVGTVELRLNSASTTVTPGTLQPYQSGLKGLRHAGLETVIWGKMSASIE